MPAASHVRYFVYITFTVQNTKVFLLVCRWANWSLECGRAELTLGPCALHCLLCSVQCQASQPPFQSESFLGWLRISWLPETPSTYEHLPVFFMCCPLVSLVKVFKCYELKTGLDVRSMQRLKENIRCFPLLLLLIQGLFIDWVWRSLFQIDWFVSELPDSACLPFPSTGRNRHVQICPLLIWRLVVWI